MMTSEEWRPVLGWPGYEVSSKGRVRSVARTVIRSDGLPHRVKERVLKPARHPDGYMKVGLSNRGRKLTRPIHVLVATAFHGPCPDGMECRHLDGDAANNTATNLKWGTRSQNQMDRVQHGTHHQVSKTRCPNGHPYDDANTYRPSTNPSHRYCRACGKEARRRYAARKVSA